MIERSVFHSILVFAHGMSLTDITDLLKLTERSVSNIAFLEEAKTMKLHYN